MESGSGHDSSTEEDKAVAQNIVGTVLPFHSAAVICAAADLELFGRGIGTDELTAEEIATRLGGDLRGLIILCDTLVGLQLLHKNSAGRYSVPCAVLRAMGDPRQTGSILSLIQHMSNVYRGWGRLAEIALRGNGGPHVRLNSIRGKEADEQAYIEAMNDKNAEEAPKIVSELSHLTCTHLLDVGGATGTWTVAFLNQFPSARATLFDLAHVIPMARQRLTEAGLLSRVTLAAGDFYINPLPITASADVAWVSAITHLNSRQQNRDLYQKVFDALVPSGVIAIRDVIMENGHTAPLGGALFAVNMLVCTEKGECCTFEEYRCDLESVGFVDVKVARKDLHTSSVITAQKP